MKELRTLYYQEKVPKENLKPGDVLIKTVDRGKYKGMVHIYRVPIWAIQTRGFLITGSGFPVTLKTALDIITNEYNDYQYVQCPENQIEIITFEVKDGQTEDIQTS